MPLTTAVDEVPVRIVGSSVFGIYPTISAERTYNMFVSSSGDGAEEWLTNFPGYAGILEMFTENVEGRGIFHSIRGGFILVVAAGAVFRINSFSNVATQIGTIGSTTGEVTFAENLSSQICFTAGGTAYIYNYVSAPSAIGAAIFNNVPVDTLFQPNYVTYQNTYFIFGNGLTTNNGSQWVVFEQDTLTGIYDLNWVQTLALQTKSDFAEAAIRIPGKGNNLLVFGSTVAEIWNNIGGLAVYQRNSSINIDFGAASVSTIAANDEVVAWLGINEQSTPALMAMKGGSASRISTDGLDNLLGTVKVPSASTAFLFRQAGHDFYVLSFIDPSDNFSIMYDFTMNKIYDVTDWDFTAFPARQIVFFNNKSYFISYKDGKIYEIGIDLTTYQLLPTASSAGLDVIYEIPRVRLTDTYRLKRPEKYKINLFTFVIESGTTQGAYEQPTCFGYIITEDTEVIIYTEDGLPILVEGGYCYINKPRVDLTISKNGGISFSNVVSYQLKATGKFQNQPRFINLGYAQQITYQLRFWGTGRFVVKNGTMEIGN
jgi:hypothetical protein